MPVSCDYRGVEIVEGAICDDYIHICVSIPPKISVLSYVGYLKGKSALMIYDRNLQIKTNGVSHFGQEDIM